MDDKDNIIPLRPAMRSQALASFSHRQPLDMDTALEELGRCLTLCAPSGMGSDERRTWLVAAWAEIKDIPIGPFLSACNTARKTCDHPSKIVPTIIRDSHELTATIRRNQNLDAAQERIALPAPYREEPDQEQLEVAAMMRDLMKKLRGNTAP
jgi:hypothetical protein